MIRRLKIISWLLLALVVVLCCLSLWVVRGSLPILNGEIAVGGLSAPATVQRDAAGVVTIDAANEVDAMRALGYVHAQERYFEMDLLRRTAAGELAELLGPSAVEADKRHRVHRLRARAIQNADAFAGNKEPQLKAYIAGITAGLADLTVRPWPYILLRQKPKPWQVEDSALVGYAMYVGLQESTNSRELALLRMEPHLPSALFALLTREGTRWDAPLVGKARGDALLPGADEVNLRQLPASLRKAPRLIDSGNAPGSNNFAVAGALTKDGRAIVADDMHSRLTAPNIWFRARLRYGDARAPSGKVDVSGFTLPGLPTMIAGSNGHVAWGFTNAYVDSLDWDRSCAENPSGNCKGSTSREPTAEVIHVKGGSPITLKFTDTPNGPLFPGLKGESPMRLRWTAYSPDALNLGLSDLNAASSLETALEAADGAGLPTANLLLADGHGRIAWTLIGPMPAHLQARICRTHPDFDACRDPTPSAAVERPTIVDPQTRRLWTANNRTLDGDALRAVGDGGYAVGARAKQVRDALFAKDTFDERDLLAIQLDDRALFLLPWWKLLHERASSAKVSPALTELAKGASVWNGRASIDSVSYRIVRDWRLAVHARIVDGLTAPAQAALGDAFEMPQIPQIEGVVWPLATQRPAHLLSRRYATWEALFEDAATEVRNGLAAQGSLSERTWGERTWGERNTARICHPLASALPGFGKHWLCMPADQLPGDNGMPRVQGPSFGATQRMVVSPGREREGFIHMPGGQSGHPLSPFWGAGHDDWVHGRPSPFLPGESRYTLKLLAPSRNAHE